MTPLLDAALAYAVAEMDLRPPGCAMPDPLALLRERVGSAIANVSFYRDLYRPYGKPPTDLEDFVDWYSSLPVVGRTDVEDVATEDRLNKTYATLPLVRKQTSGSTGIPLVLFIDQTVASFRSWRFRRPHFASGETSPNTVAFLFPESFKRRRQASEATVGDGTRAASRKEKSYSTLTNALQSPELIYRDLAAKEPVTLMGYASSLGMLAEWMGGTKRLPTVKRIWTTSEMMTPDGREAIRKAFGFEPREVYSSVEFGFMGWQAEPGGRYLLETDRLFFQTLGLSGEKESEPGRVIVSDLLNDTTPLLRYDIGDLAIMSSSAPSSPYCDSIEELHGKITDVVYDAAGKRVEPFALLGCLKKTIGFAQYRLVCVERDLFILQYRSGSEGPGDLDAALSGLRQIVGTPIKVFAQEVPTIAREKSGKLRPIINLSAMRGNARDQLLLQLHLADFRDYGADVVS